MKQLTKCYSSRGRRKLKTLGGVSVKWCPSPRCGFACGSDPCVWPCLCVTYTEQTLGRNSERPREPAISPSRTSPHSPTLYLRSLRFILPRTHSTSLSSFPVLFKPSHNLFAFWISSMLHTSPALPILRDLIRLVANGVGSYQNRYHERQKTSTA